MRKALQSAELRKLLRARGYDIIGSTPEQFGATIRSDIAKWERVVKESKIARIN
jgi:tripartite-type tricarboxylate transporter receptor subunit TctC